MDIKELRSEFISRMYKKESVYHVVNSGWIFSDPPKTDETILAYTRAFGLFLVKWDAHSECWNDLEHDCWFVEDDIICWVSINIPTLEKT
jgi:hypothetical protein